MRPSALVAALFALFIAQPAAAETPPPPLTAPLLRDHPLVGRLWAPAEAAFLTAGEMVTRARGHDTVLLGETHDNADHHVLQAWLVARLAPSLVAFEMIDSSQAPALAAHLAAHPGDAAGLGAALGWDKSGWPDWDGNYRPVAQAALDRGAVLAAANLSRDETKEIAKGGIPAAWTGKLGLEKPQAPDQRQAMEADIQAGHCGMLPARSLPAMVRVQRARDAVMAHSLTQAPRAVLIAGAGHVRRDRAVPSHLSEMAPSRRVFAIAFVEVQEGKTDPAAYAENLDAETLPYDAVWFTPRVERPDPCEAFRRHLEKKKD